MKPLKLTMHAFGPYRDKTVIDFTRLGDGLFLIMGNNGAGKTMIFDALTYALFGETSGSRRQANSLHSDLSDERTWVELEFTHGGFSYKVRREPPQKVLKRDGTYRDASATAELFRGTTCLGTKKNDVDRAMYDILGMDARQWGQIVMLAQGEFMKLLDTSSKERVGILRDLFDTGRFADLQGRLSEMAGEKSSMLDARRSDLNAVFKEISADDTDPSGMSREEVFSLLTEYIDRDRATVEEAERSKEKAYEQYTRAVAERAVAEEVSAKFDELASCRSTVEELEGRRAEIDGKRDIRQKIEASAPLDGMMRALEEHRAELDRAVRENNECSARRAHLQAELDGMADEIGRIPEYEAEAGRLRSQAEAVAETLPRYAEAQDLEISIQSLENKCKETEQRIAATEEEIGRLAGEAASLRETASGAEQAAKETIVAESRINELSAEMMSLDSLAAECDSLVEDEMRLSMLEEEFQRADMEATHTSEAYERAESAFMRAQAGLLARDLLEGVPCPVCGSVHHPSPAGLPEGTPTESEVRALRTSRDSAAEDRSRLSNETAMARARFQTRALSVAKATGVQGRPTEHRDAVIAKKAALSTEIAEAESRLASARSRLATARDAAKRIEEASMRTDMLRNRVDEFRYVSSDMAAKTAASKARLDSLRGSLQYPDADAANVAADGMSYKAKELRARISELRLRSENLNQEIGVLASKVESNGRTVDRLTPTVSQDVLAIGKKMAECGLNMIQYKALASYDRDSLDAEISAFDERMGYASRRASELGKELEGRERPDSEAIAARVQAAMDTMNEAEAALRDAGTRLAKNEKAMSELDDLWDRYETAELESQQIGRMADAANGKLAGTRRVQFEQYIQTVFFDEVLESANIRLDAMSGGRFALLRSEGDGDMRSQTALDIDVLDNYTGKKRAVKSLSGGESFKAALALALGLSDTIQCTAGGNRVEALFIDEGFGSLDAESLEQAIHVLEGLTEGDVMVGVISHVEMLMESIPKRIMVERDRDHGSRVKIVTD